MTDRSEFVISYTEPRATDLWFTNGGIKMTSGPNSGVARQIRKFTLSTNTVELWAPFPADVSAAETFDIHAGCDKTFLGGCTTFARTGNYGGFIFNIKDFLALE